MKHYLVMQRGKKYTNAIIKTKDNRFSPVENVEVIAKRGVVLITGGANAGKSRMLSKLKNEAAAIWRGATMININARSPLSEWLADFDGKTTQARIDELEKKLEAGGVVALIDNAHLLTGRKLEVAKLVVVKAKSVVMTAININRLPVSLRYLVDGRKPKIINLHTKASYDATQILILFCALIALVGGAWEIAAGIGALGVLSRGRGASNNA